MTEVIKVQNLSKRYRLGLKEKQAETLIGQFRNILKSPFSNLQKLRKMNRFSEEDESIFWALKDINFEVKEGEVLGIIGKNGAGKSTLLKILSQITEPTSGKIEIQGRVASLLEVGTGFHPELSGRDNIYMNGTILGMTRKEINLKLDEIIDFSGVEKFIDTPVKFYSSGMKVRLGFSVAAHLEPEILIIDEVLAVGDYEFQKKCLGKMKDVAGHGRTVLFVSHNLEAVKSLCTSALLLENSLIKRQGITSEVVGEYLFAKNNSLLDNNWSYDLAPGNDWIKLASISLKSESYDSIGILSREEDLVIKIGFWVEKNNVPLNLSIHLNSDTGQCVMNVISQVPVPILSRGLHYSECVIPKRLLNEGGYSISIYFVKDTSIVIYEIIEILVFELFETKKRDHNWYGKFEGLIHPDLNFKILTN
tara:strand:+ start:6673 stop:7935 length:1263 start_codon:yes stop_codon:yes gene_type:complete